MGKKKRRRRSNTLKVEEMPADPADQGAADDKSPANGHKKGLPASLDNAGRLAADHDEVPADWRIPTGRYETLSPKAQAEYRRLRDMRWPHADALDRAIEVEEGEEQ